MEPEEGPYYMDIAPSAEKYFLRLQPDIQRRLKPKLDALPTDPRPYYAVALQGHKSVYRIKVGDYRIVYKVYDEDRYLYVTLIGHRGSVYRDLGR